MTEPKSPTQEDWEELRRRLLEAGHELLAELERGLRPLIDALDRAARKLHLD